MKLLKNIQKKEIKLNDVEELMNSNDCKKVNERAILYSKNLKENIETKIKNLYEYKNKITELVNCMFAQSGFKNRVMNVMDWIYDNQEYNQLFSHIFNEVMGEPRLPLIGSSIKQLESDNEAQTTAEDLKGGCRMMDDCVKYLDSIVSRLMQEAYDEGVITETDSTKRNITAMSGMIQYGCMLMMESHRQMSAMTDEQLRQFIYGNIIKCLN